MERQLMIEPPSREPRRLPASWEPPPPPFVKGDCKVVVDGINQEVEMTSHVDTIQTCAKLLA
ncbi:conserved hypothetical protein [Ricinus communis]|uniref:Uncharacterized protein n=1 Tax=Ricinus communis TaxID=3988 RepID=B9SYC7_RICCO|nr:conserved hypothetical protein [Ricinus communis]